MFFGWRYHVYATLNSIGSAGAAIAWVGDFYPLFTPSQTLDSKFFSSPFLPESEYDQEFYTKKKVILSHYVVQLFYHTNSVLHLFQDIRSCVITSSSPCPQWLHDLNLKTSYTNQFNLFIEKGRKYLLLRFPY